MTRTLSYALIVALLAPTIVLAAPPPIDDSLAGSPTYAADQALQQTANNIKALSDTGQQVGCSSDGNIGGALANAVGVGLQRGLGGLIQNVGGRFLGDIASKAGPLSGLVNQLGQKGLQWLSGQAQNLIGSIFPDAANVAAGLAGGALGSVAGGALGVGSVPTTETNQALLGDVKATNAQTRATQAATETLVQKECVLDPTTARIMNSILTTITRSETEWLSNGFEGAPAFAENLSGLAKDITQAVFERVEDEVLSGICSPARQPVQQALLTQYQYEVNVGQRVQCSTDEGKLAASIRGEWEAGGGWQGFHSLIFSNDAPITSYYVAQDVKNKAIQGALKEQFTLLSYGDGFKTGVTCDTEASIPIGGGICINGQVVKPGSLIREQANQVIVRDPKSQILNADEIGEVVDSLMAGLTQMVFQSIDGLFSATKKNRTQGGDSLSYLDQLAGDGSGSYLDTAVDEASGGSLSAGRSALLNDLDGVKGIEEDYSDILKRIIDNLQDTKKNYTDVAACYNTLTTTISTKISTQTALDRMNSASSTVAQLITPQITSLSAKRVVSENTIDELEAIITEAENAQTIADLAAVTTRYQAFVAEGVVHTSTDLRALQNDLQVGAVALQALNVDAKAKLAECRQL